MYRLPRLQVETKLVDVGVVVRNRQGHALSPVLPQDDFKIYDEGKERAITAFSIDTSKLALAAALDPAWGSPAVADAIARGSGSREAGSVPRAGLR